MHRFAHFDAEEPFTDAMCISSFLVSVQNGGLLLGKMKVPAVWDRLDRVASGDRAFTGWVLPAGHLRVGEGPDAAARRIAEEQLGVSPQGLRLSHTLSWAEPMEERDQALHWDLCFVYDAEMDVETAPEWFAELKRIPLPEVSREMMRRGHDDVLEAIGLLSEK
jgi:ADP-ribose pyrophosphatase YjhB (NUDIX family)